MPASKASFPHRKLRCLAAAKTLFKNEETPSSLSQLDTLKIISYLFRDKRLIEIRYYTRQARGKIGLRKFKVRRWKEKHRPGRFFPVYFKKVRKSFFAMQAPRTVAILLVKGSETVKLFRNPWILRYQVRDRNSFSAERTSGSLVFRWQNFFSLDYLTKHLTLVFFMKATFKTSHLVNMP